MTVDGFYEQPWPEGEYRFFQLGFVVDDLLGAAARWAAVFGVGPFHVLPVMEPTITMRGVASPVRFQVAVAQAGPVQVELIQQHCDRPSIFRSPLFSAGRGLHQLATVTWRYDERRAWFVSQGFEIAGELDARGQRIAYVDTLAEFGFFTEVVEATPEFVPMLTRISRTCAEWDGSDPVRILTRDGYRTP